LLKILLGCARTTFRPSLCSDLQVPLACPDQYKFYQKYTIFDVTVLKTMFLDKKRVFVQQLIYNGLASFNYIIKLFFGKIKSISVFSEYRYIDYYSNIKVNNMRSMHFWASRKSLLCAGRILCFQENVEKRFFSKEWERASFSYTVLLVNHCIYKMHCKA
jgi:hypothetical protein